MTERSTLLVLSHRGVRIGVVGHYGLFDEVPTFKDAVHHCRAKLANGHARSFVAIRVEAAVIDGFGDGVDRELARFEAYPDRVVLVPPDQGGLDDTQKARVHALPKGQLL